MSTQVSSVCIICHKSYPIADTSHFSVQICPACANARSQPRYKAATIQANPSTDLPSKAVSAAISVVAAIVNGFKWLFVMSIIGGFLYLIWNDTSSDTSKPAKSPPFNQPQQTLPYSGAIQMYVSASRQAPLQIVTQGSDHYLVKLVNAYSDSSVMTIFIRGGSTVEVDVPLGSYKIKYASGSTWYGYEYLFGPETGYSIADEVFNFTSVGGRISGYTLTLYRVSGGNLRTSAIKPSMF